MATSKAQFIDVSFVFERSFESTQLKEMVGALRNLANQLESVGPGYELIINPLPDDLLFRCEYDPRHVSAEDIKRQTGWGLDPSLLLLRYDQIKLRARAKYFLADTQLRYVGDIIVITQEELERMAKEAKRDVATVQEIRKALLNLGLDLGTNVPKELWSWFTARTQRSRL